MLMVWVFCWFVVGVLCSGVWFGVCVVGGVL